MHFSIAAWHVPEREGTATGRALRALCDGLLEEGHGVDVWSFGDFAPREELPAWATWRPLARGNRLAEHGRALIRPRWEPARNGWAPAEGAIALADDAVAFGAVARFPRSVVTVHYATGLDAAALGRRELRDWQDRRHERFAVRRAELALAFSDRVAGFLGGRPTVVPIALPVPPEPLPPVDEPTAVMIADWGWPPNHRAVADLLAAWPDVRRAVPGARLLLAGRGHAPVGTVPGVTVLGEVPSVVDALGAAAVLAFPCPPTSGPKVKVLEALSYGMPVVTTAAGVEGLDIPAEAAVVTSPARLAADLAAVLRDPARRAVLGATGRAAMAAAHGPRPAARARVAACAALAGLPAA